MCLVTSSGTSTGLYIPFAKERPHSYRGYSSTAIEKAYDAVKSGDMSIRRAAEEYGIPRTTLHNKVSGKVDKVVKSGPKTYLTDEEECKLVEFLVGCASIGYAKSLQDVLSIAERIVNCHYGRADKVHLSKGWWEKFCKCHPEISLRHAEPLSYARAVANNPVVIKRYFDLLEQNELASRPGQIFCDETGMPLTHKPPKVVAQVHQKHPYTITSGDKSQITVMASASASRYAIPPMVVYDRKHLQKIQRKTTPAVPEK